MPDKRISELTAVITPADTDQFATNQGGVTKMETRAQIVAGAVASASAALAAHAATYGHVPVGSIVLWSGAVGAIPSGWHLCDGTAGTPDLRDRFVVGAGGGYAVGATGGAASVNLQHAHTNASESSHTHAATGLSTGNESSHTHTAASEASHTHTQGNTGDDETYHSHGLSGSTASVTAGRQLAQADASGNYVVRGWGTDPFTDSHSHSLAGIETNVTGIIHRHTNPTTNAGSAHTHSIGAGSAHNHSVTGSTAAGSAHTHTMNSQLSATQDIRPPYYALAYIMRVA